MDIGSAKEHDIVVNEGFLYYGNFSNISADDTFIKTLADKLLGVTQDKISVSIKPKIRQIKNAAMKVKGWETIDEWDAKITGELLDFNEKLLEASLFKQVKDSDKIHYETVQGLIDESNYKDLLIVGKNISGNPIIVHVKNTYNTAGITLDLVGKSDAAVKFEFDSAYESKKINPVAIYGSFTEMQQAQLQTQ